MADEQPGATIEDYLIEDRTFPPPEDFKEAVAGGVAVPLRRGQRGLAGLLGPAGRRPARLGRGVAHDPRVGAPVREVVRRAASSTSATTPSTATCAAGRGDKVAYHWEGEPGDTRTITYADLHADVQRFANVLKGLGVAKGDRICIYMPMIPELPVAMLACARIGAPHSVVFGGFSPDSLIDRINDAECKVVITADGGFRRGAPSMLKPNVDAAVASTPSVEHVVVVRRVDEPVEMVEGRDHWWHDLMADGRRRVPVRADGQRGPALPALHLGHHGQAQGHHAHDGRLPHPGRLHPQVRVRPPPRRPTSTGARPTSAGSPGTATSSTGRSPTGPPR